MENSFRRYIHLSLAIFASLAIIACGGSGDSSDSDDSESSPLLNDNDTIQLDTLYRVNDRIDVTFTPITAGEYEFALTGNESDWSFTIFVEGTTGPFSTCDSDGDGTDSSADEICVFTLIAATYVVEISDFGVGETVNFKVSLGSSSD